MTTGQIDEKSIFTIARAIDSPVSRDMYLNQVCGGDPAMRQRVEALLHVHDSQRCLLKSAAPAVALTLDLSTPVEQPGTQIGPYKLLEQIGEGGMGIVYVASQKEPLRRKVALKIIKPGMDTREVVARFEAERQALALMDHPNIAKVFDAGATDAGRPYFAMELVRGKPINDYCDHDQLSNRERLKLFVAVCQGVQHAHQKGIIHRDLKPSNILIKVYDVRPVPVVIDFGIAKAVGQQLAQQSLHTAFDQMVGTPLYMSPEQAGQSCQDVDTRSDIYSLGVVLYELLTSHTPFEKDTLRTGGVDEMRRIIREVDPPRPSARVSTLQAADLSTIAARHRIEPSKLSSQLRGDLDWIVMKAMDKDRDRRYASASALAADVQRYLDDEPVQARPPSLARHAAKWVRRHRPLVWSSAAVLAVTVGAAGVMLGASYRRATLLEQDAGEHLAAATAFLGSGNYAAADRELADARGHLEAAGRSRGLLQDKMVQLALPIAAVKRFEEFQSLRQRIHSEMYVVDRTILDQAKSRCRSALNLFGVFGTAPWKSRADFENLDPARQEMLDEDVVELLFIWARLEMGRSDTQPAAERAVGYRRAIEALGKIESFHPSIPAVALWMADCCEAIGDTQAAVASRARAESLQPKSAMDHFLLGEYHAQHGRQEQALVSYWQSLAQQPDHYLSILAAGVALGQLQEYKSAEAMLTGAIALHPQATLGYVKRGINRLGQGKVLLAQADFQESVKLDPELAAALTRRAGSFRDNLELDKASADLDEAIRLDPKSAWAYTQRSLVYIFRGELDKAIADCNAAIQLDAKYTSAYANRAGAYRCKGELDKAFADSNKAIRLDSTFFAGYFERGCDYDAQGEYDKALADLNEALRLDPANAPSAVLPSRANVYRGRGEYDKAMADCNEAIRLSPKDYWAYISRADVHQAQGDVEKALADLNEAIRLAPWTGYWYCKRGGLYFDLGEFEKAAADYDRAAELPNMDSYAYKRRGVAHFRVKHYDKALESIAKAVELNPGDGSNLWWIEPVELAQCPDEHFQQGFLALADKAIETTQGGAQAHTARAMLYDAFGRDDEARIDFNKALELAPTEPLFWEWRAAFHAEHARWNETLADLTKSIELQPERMDCWYKRCLARLSGGQVDEYRQDCREMLQRVGKTDNAGDHFFVAWACVVTPNAANDWSIAVAAAEKIVQSAPPTATWLTTLGALLYRAGRYDEALARLSEAAALAEQTGAASNLSPAYAWFFLAMTQHRLGHTEEAKHWLDKAVTWTDKTLAEANHGNADLPWNRQLTLKLLRDEATTLLGVTLPTAETAPEPSAKVEEAKEHPKSTPTPEAPKADEETK